MRQSFGATVGLLRHLEDSHSAHQILTSLFCQEKSSMKAMASSLPWWNCEVNRNIVGVPSRFYCESNITVPKPRRLNEKTNVVISRTALIRTGPANSKRSPAK